jgi:uncharacterized protein
MIAVADTSFVLAVGNRNEAIHEKCVALLPDDLNRTAQILNQYADSRIDFVDATLAAVAERMQVTRILTLDRRDFQIFRPNHVDRFEIFPV